MMSELGRETVSAYAAAKGGLKMLTKNIASEYGEYNIQCNGIGPGYIETPQTAPLRERQADGSRHPFDQFIIAKTPAARWGHHGGPCGPGGVPCQRRFQLRPVPGLPACCARRPACRCASFSRRDPGAVPHIVSVLQQEELPAVVAAARNISVHQATEEIHVEKIGQAGENNTLRKDVLFRMHRVRHRHIFRHDRAALQELKVG